MTIGRDWGDGDNVSFVGRLVVPEILPLLNCIALGAFPASSNKLKMMLEY